MQDRFTAVIVAALSVLCLFSLTSCAGAQVDENPFDVRDFTGVWHLEGGSGEFGPPNPPALTPAGMAAMQGRVPSRSVDDPSLSNDPSYECNPEGFPKLLFDAEPMEIMQLPDRLLQTFQWEGRIRYIWLDGRDLPTGENLDNLGPAWYGHSVAEWQGDTLVVNTVGSDDRAWLDRPGHPRSFNARVEERYRLLDPDTIQVQLTIEDPEYYSAVWMGDPKIFKRLSQDQYTFFGWEGIFSGTTEQICAPMNEVETYNELFRDLGAEGITPTP